MTLPTAFNHPLRAVRDDAKIARAHRITGREAQRELRRGLAAHVFDDGVDLNRLEQCVWSQGVVVGPVTGSPHRLAWDRFIWQSPTPIGRRVQTGMPDLPLIWVEIKGKVNHAGEWIYHLVPRRRPAR